MSFFPWRPKTPSDLRTYLARQKRLQALAQEREAAALKLLAHYPHYFR